MGAANSVNSCIDDDSPSINVNDQKVPINEIIENLKRSALIPNFKGLVVTPSSKDYNEVKYQYATSSYPASQMSPSMICYPEDTDDIIAVLQYAPKHKKNVIVRSGGCQYSGLSSGGKSDIIIDMQSFNKLEITDTNKLSIGPCNRLGNVAPFLNKHGVALPMGDCECVNIGGHVQTGGYGNILRGFGLCLDHVVSFDIITANGKLLHITKPGTEDEDDRKTAVSDDNDDLYWAVMGGNPGSFGIVTEYNFRCIKDSDHPNSAGIQCYFLYTEDTLMSLLNAFAELVHEMDGQLPPDYDFMFTTASLPYLPFAAAIIFEGAYSNVKGAKEDYDSSFFDKIVKSAGIDPYHTEFHGKKAISEMMIRFVKHINREYDFPYEKTLRGTTRPWGKGFVDSYCKKASELLEKTGFDDGFKFISQLQMGGGAYYTNDPQSKVTSISHRNVKIGFTFDIFYDDKWNKKAHQKAIDFQNECKKLWVDGGLFSVKKKDIRFTWGTFGDTNIENVWQFYYDDKKKYDKLRKIKTKIDPTNLFHNRFTIPPVK